MIGKKYRYNPDSISFEKQDSSIIARFKRLFPFITLSFIFAITMVIVFFFFIDSPKEKAFLRDKNEILSQYQVLNNELNVIKKELSDLQYRDDNIYRTIFEADPISQDIRQAGFGGTDKYENLRHLDAKEIVANTSQRFDIISKQLYIQSKSFDQVAKLAKRKKDMMACIPAILPISSDQIKRIGHYGMRIHPIYKIPKMHEGMDFTATTGTPIYATGNGKVIEVKKSYGGYGNQVMIDHGFGYETRYAHLKLIKVRKGQEIKRGDLIGTVGSSGLSTGPHLHYEVLKNLKHVNPINYYFEDISPKEYNEMIHHSLQYGGQSLD